MAKLGSVCVFCGSSAGARPDYVDAARSLGGLLATRGIRMVYGGASVGLMGVAANAALAAGGTVIGVMPRSMAEREIAHTGLTELHIVETMHERKALMAALSDGFIAMPGGFGTLEEFFEVLTWGQLGIHRKPHALLDVAGYWAPLLAAMEHMVAERFVRPAHRALVLSHAEPEVLLERMEGVEMPEVGKWITAAES